MYTNLSLNLLLFILYQLTSAQLRSFFFYTFYRCYWKPFHGDCVIDRLSECSTASDEAGRICACENTKDVDYRNQCPSPFLTSQNEEVHTDANKDWLDADAGKKLLLIFIFFLVF